MLVTAQFMGEMGSAVRMSRQAIECAEQPTRLSFAADFQLRQR